MRPWVVNVWATVGGWDLFSAGGEFAHGSTTDGWLTLVGGVASLIVVYIETSKR